MRDRKSLRGSTGIFKKIIKHENQTMFVNLFGKVGLVNSLFKYYGSWKRHENECTVNCDVQVDFLRLKKNLYKT